MGEGAQGHPEGHPVRSGSYTELESSVQSLSRVRLFATS